MSLGGGSSGQAYAFPGGGGGSEAVSAPPPPPEEFQPNAGPPVTVPAPQQPPFSHVFTCQYCAKQGPNSIEKMSGFSFGLRNGLTILV